MNGTNAENNHTTPSSWNSTSVVRPAIVHALFGLVLATVVAILIGCSGGGGGGGGGSSNPVGGASGGVISGKILRAASSGSGRVVANHGEAVPRANLLGDIEVWVEEYPQFRTRTASDGSYLLSGIPLGSVHLVAKDQTGATLLKARSLQEIVVSAAAPAILELTVTPAVCRVAGVLRNADGTPVAAGTILTLWGETFTVQSDGRFETPPVPEGYSENEIYVSPSGGSLGVTFMAAFAPGDQPAMIETTVPATARSHPPVVNLRSSVGGQFSTKVNPGDLITLTAVVQDSGDLSAVTGAWECSLGTLAETANPFVRTWTAPMEGTLATVTVTVTDGEGTIARSRLTFTVGTRIPSSEKAISRFAFLSPAMSAAVDASTRMITAVLPAGTDRRSLIAEFSTSGWKVLANGREHKSGITPADYSGPVTFTVVAEDGSTIDYFVYVTCADAPVSAGKAIVVGAPPAIAATTTAEFRIGGEGITAYRYKLDEENWTSEFPMRTGILLFDLPRGRHTLAVVGRDANGIWQDESDATYYFWTIDTALLTVTVDQDSQQPDPTNASTATFLVLFSSPVTGFTSEAIDLTGTTTGNTKTATVKGSGALYTVRVTVSGGSADGVFRIAVKPASVSDANGNRNQASQAIDDRVTRDSTAPVVLASPLTTGDTTPALTGKVDDPTAVIKVTVGEIAYDALNLGNGTWILPDDTIAQPLASGIHDISVAATDLAGNIGRDYSTGELKIDPGILTLTLNQRSGQPDPTNRDQVEFSAVFSKSVTGFGSAAVDLSGTTAGGTKTVEVIGSGATYIVRVTLSDAPNQRVFDGVIRASVPAGVVRDTAGNLNSAAVSTDNEVIRDTQAPNVTIQRLTTAELRPALSGAIDDLLASITVFVNGASFTAENRRDGTWLLASGKMASDLSNGVYDLEVRAIDRAGNIGTASAEAGLTVDAGPLTAAIDQKPGQRDPTAGTQFDFVISFNRPVIDFDRSKLDLSESTAGGTKTVSVIGTGASYTVRIVLSGTVKDGVVSCKVSPGTIHDLARNINSGMTILDNRVTRDTVAPVVSVTPLTTGDTTPAVAGRIDDPLASVTVVINKMSYPAANQGDGTWLLADDQIVSPLTEGKYEVEATAVDAAGNIGRDKTIQELAIDPKALTVAITQKTGQVDPTNKNFAEFSIVFSKPVTGFATPAVDLSATTAGGTRLATLSGSGAQYVLRLALEGTPTDGLLAISIPAGRVQDSAGNGNLPSNDIDATVTRDTVAPVVTVASLTTSDTRPPLRGTVDDASATVTVTVESRPYAALNAGDGTWTLPDDRIAYALRNGVIDIVAVAVDRAGNSGRDNASGELRIDATPLTVTISRAPGQSDTISGREAAFRIVFNKPVTGFTSAMVDTSETTVGTIQSVSLSGEGATYSATILVQEPVKDGVIRARVKAGNVRDEAGNLNTVSVNAGNTVTRDTTPPRVSMNPVFTNDPRPPLSGTVNEASATVSVVIQGVWYSAVNNRNGTWTLADNLIPTALPDGSYDLELRAADGSGNEAIATFPAGLTIDSTPPGVTIRQAAGQIDPTRLNQAEFEVVFSEPVLNFDFNKIDLSGSTIGGNRALTVTGTGTTWLVRLAITGSVSDGLYKIKINPGVVRDLAGNWNLPATVLDASVTRDTVPPIVSVKALTSIDSTPPLNGAVNESLATVSVIVGGKEYSAINNHDGTWTLPDDTITPPLPDGVYDVRVLATDTAGNTGADVTTGELTINATLLPVVVSLAEGQRNPMNQDVAEFSVLFGRAVSDFDAGDIDLAGTTVGGTQTVSISGSGASYTVRVALSGAVTDGVVRVRINAGVAHDAGGFANAASNITGNLVERDTVAPGAATLNAVVSPTWLATQTLTGTKPAAAERVLVNGTGTGVIFPTSTSWRFDLALSAGVNQVRVVSADLAGNESSPVTAAIEYDVTYLPPANAIQVQPIGGTVVAGTLNSTNTNLTAHATIVAGVVANGEAELLFNGAPLFPAVKDGSISAEDTTVTFDCLQNSTAGLQSMLSGTGVFSVRLRTLDGRTSLSTLGNPSLTVDYTSPTAPTGIYLIPVGGTTVANTLNDTNTNFQARASINAGEATGGEAELLLDGVAFVPPIKDTGIAANDTTVTFDLGQSSAAGVQSLIKSGGAVSVRLRDAAGNVIESLAGNPTLTVAYTVPRVSLSTDAPNPMTSIATITCLIKFSEDVTDFTAADLRLENCVVDDFFGFGATYAVDLVVTGSGNPRIWVGANAAANTAGVGNAATSAISLAVQGADGADVMIDGSVYVLVPRTTLPDGTVVPAFYCGKFPATVGSENASGGAYPFDVTYQTGGDGKRHRAATNSIGRPWVLISWTDAKKACTAAGCGLISENQWLAIAHSSLGLTANWRNAATGTTEVSGGGFYRGLSSSTVSRAQPALGGDQGSSPAPTSSEYRVKRLPNKAEIWDVGGNVWQWIDGVQATGTWYTGCSVAGWYETNQTEITLGKIRTPYSSSHGVGKIYNYSVNSPRPLVRGGSWNTFTIAGAFSLILDVDVNSGFRDFGFRCVRQGP